MNEHTTLIVVLSDGSHRSTQWFERVKWTRIVESMKDTVCHSAITRKPVGAVVIIGTQIQQYTAGEVMEFTS